MLPFFTRPAALAALAASALFLGCSGGGSPAGDGAPGPRNDSTATTRSTWDMSGVPPTHPVRVALGAALAGQSRPLRARGIVVDPDGRPINGVTMEATVVDSLAGGPFGRGSERRVTRVVDGTFEVTGTGTGVSLRFVKPGYRERRFGADLKPEGPAELGPWTVILPPVGPPTVLEVRRARRPQGPGPAVVVDLGAPPPQWEDVSPAPDAAPAVPANALVATPGPPAPSRAYTLTLTAPDGGFVRYAPLVPNDPSAPEAEMARAPAEGYQRELRVGDKFKNGAEFFFRANGKYGRGSVREYVQSPEDFILQVRMEVQPDGSRNLDTKGGQP